MPLTPQDVKDKLFTSVRFKQGYDEDEVDSFLDEVESELTSLVNEIGRLRAANEQLEKALAAARRDSAVRAEGPPAPSGIAPPAQSTPGPAVPTFAPRPTAPSQLLPAVQGTAEYALSQPLPPPSPTEDALRRTLLIAQRTADEVIAEARTEAEQLVSGARQQKDETLRLAATEHAAAMHQRQAEHDLLVSKLEELRAFERDYRGRLRAYLHLQLRDLEAAAPEPPAAVMSASRAALSASPPAGGQTPMGADSSSATSSPPPNAPSGPTSASLGGASKPRGLLAPREAAEDATGAGHPAVPSTAAPADPSSELPWSRPSDDSAATQ